jgi:MinD superfamily P-loop ATPase
MQLIILSGKGGTGKTTVAASFAYLQKEGVKVDCDVEALICTLFFREKISRSMIFMVLRPQ